MTALHQQQIDPNQIEAVLVTHLHGDHFGGLPFLVLDGQFRRRTHDLTVFGPPGTRTRLEQAMEILFPGSSGVQRRFAVHVVEYADRRTLVLGPLRVTAYEVCPALPRGVVPWGRSGRGGQGVVAVAQRSSQAGAQGQSVGRCKRSR